MFLIRFLLSLSAIERVIETLTRCIIEPIHSTFWNTGINKWKLEVMRSRKSYNNSLERSFQGATFQLIKVEFDFQKRKNWSGVVEIADTTTEEENDTRNSGTTLLRHGWIWRNWTVELWKMWHPLLNPCWASSLFSRRRNIKFLSERQICVKFVLKTVRPFLCYFVPYKRRKNIINFLHKCMFRIYIL